MDSEPARTGHAISRDGVEVRYDVGGRGTPALVFVHGWSCDRTYWAAQMRAFAPRHRVVAVDLAGHGESGVDRRSWTMASFGDDVAAVVNHLGLDRVVLVGHSMGGDVIVETALRLGKRVRGVVWVDTYANLGHPRNRDQVEAILAPLREDFVAAARTFVRGMFTPDADPALVEWIVADMSSAPPAVAIDALRHAISNDERILEALPRLPAPIAAINPGSRPTDLEALRRHGVRASVMPNVGHFLMLEAPEEFNRLLDETIARFG